MAAVSNLTKIDTVRVDAILSDAVVLSWGDLMPELTSGLIHIEYHVEPQGSVEYMKVWASTVRGYWNLVCEHWMRWDSSHQSGLHFRAGYTSATLSKMLDAIMQHQAIFLVGAAPGKDHVIQVYPPTGAVKVAASRMMEVFHDRLSA